MFDTCRSRASIQGDASEIIATLPATSIDVVVTSPPYFGLRDYQGGERGIAVYADQAARPEVVDDLHMRVAYAAAKIEAAERPKVRKPRGSNVAAIQAPVLETLICESCGASFEPERTRGRKPKACPVCRGLTSPVVSSSFASVKLRAGS
jgi:hypothetical protein